MSADPHRDTPLERAGPPVARAASTMVALHGRGADAADMLALWQALALPQVAVAAPQAAGRSWWPSSFLAPLPTNEPALSSALARVGRVVAGLKAEGAERIVLLGFSQGACLALEHAARSGERWHAVIGLSGGLVGTGDGDGPATDALHGHAPKAFDYTGRLEGVPVVLACHERDPHIPLARVRESASVLGAMGASVTMHVHPGAGHAVMAEDVKAVRALLNE
ncbi:alpha/beta hydrolase [Acuticoccus sp.]|uniref:alpha/beta hydrolase n=1 Tax=Acuticoccus sp. TaxID=1904378 RepID=UPI003B52F013